MSTADRVRRELQRRVDADPRPQVDIACAAWPVRKGEPLSAPMTRQRKLRVLLDPDKPHAADLDELDALARALGCEVRDFLKTTEPERTEPAMRRDRRP